MLIVCLVLFGCLYGGSYAFSRRVGISSSGSMVIMDYAWATGNNSMAQALFTIHRPLIAVDKAFSDQNVTMLELEAKAPKPTVVVPDKESKP